MSGESVELPTASNDSLTLALNYINTKFWVKFDGICLKQDNITFKHKQVVSVYIAYEINLWAFNVDKDFELANCLVGTVRFTKNADLDKHKS